MTRKWEQRISFRVQSASHAVQGASQVLRNCGCCDRRRRSAHDESLQESLQWEACEATHGRGKRCELDGGRWSRRSFPVASCDAIGDSRQLAI